MSLTFQSVLPTRSLLRGPAFDLAFLLGITALAFASGLAASLSPDLLIPIVTLDLWLLGYHHVIATYTRMAFDHEGFVAHRAKLLGWLPLVAMAVTACLLVAGPWSIASIYLYWQWYHYTRQSEGIAKAYASKAGISHIPNTLVHRMAFYSVPVAGILDLSARAPETFLFMPLRVIPIPELFASVFGLVALAAFLVSMTVRCRAALRDRGQLPYVIYLLSHYAVYFTAYIGVKDVTIGWLVINIWHNAQYILFVWLYNNRKFRGGVVPSSLVLSTISQDRRFLLYIAFCLTLSTAVYFGIESLLLPGIGSALGVGGTSAALIAYQTFNFHHYLVDASIWKLRKKNLREKLGLT